MPTSSAEELITSRFPRQRQPETSREGGFWSFSKKNFAGQYWFLPGTISLGPLYLEDMILFLGNPVIVLSEEQRQRYKNQLCQPGMNEARQEKLLAGWCLVIGDDLLAELVLEHLVDAGVGFVKLAGASINSETAGSTLDTNPDVRCSRKQLSDLSDKEISAYNLIVDATRDWQYKLNLSDICMRLEVPMVHGGITGSRMQVYTMVPGKSACLRCSLPKAGIDDVPLEPTNLPPFRPVLACLGSMMALEAVKLIAGLGATQGNELWKLDGLSGEFEIVRGLDPQPDCPDCRRK
jgi:molybdopterin/thiamine biosynthesis adenylyltransferase